MKSFDEMFAGVAAQAMTDDNLAFLREPVVEKPDEDVIVQIEEEDHNIPIVEPKPTESVSATSLSDDDINRLAAILFDKLKPTAQEGGNNNGA